MRRPSFGPLVALAAIATATLALATAAIAQTQDPFQVPESPATEDPKKDARPEPKARPKEKEKEPERVVKSLEEWQKQLTHEQFMVTRMKATEAAFTGKYAHGHWKGNFLCVCCGARLFDARHKFDSGTGWPSFDRAVSGTAIETAWDYSEAEARMEVTCRRCGAHLGHVFQDGPTSTGLRFCINSAALKLDSEKEAAAPAKKAARPQASRSGRLSSKARRPAAAPAEKTSSDEASQPRS